MIHRKPTTAKGYLYYHRLYYGRIVKAMEKGVLLDKPLKVSVWNELFSFKCGDSYCFACFWANQNIENGYEYDDDDDCEDCLLDVDDDEDCLGGLYSTATGISDQRIEAARKIRDLDMKEKWK